MPTTFGTATVTKIFKHESHKLHLEFEVADANTVHVGEPVGLNTAGKVVALAADAPRFSVLGVSLHDGVGADGDRVTIAVRGYMVVYGEAAADSTPAGSVELGAMNATTGYREYAVNSGADNAAKSVLHVGFALEAGDNGDVIPVLLG